MDDAFLEKLEQERKLCERSRQKIFQNVLYDATQTYLFAAGSFGLMFATGIYSKQYEGVGEQIVRGYAFDGMVPFSYYFMGKCFGFNEKDSFLFPVLICCAGEVLQGAGLYNGTFDPYDFIAYAAGAGLAVGLDKVTSRKKSLDEVVKEVVEEEKEQGGII